MFAALTKESSAIAGFYANRTWSIRWDRIFSISHICRCPRTISAAHCVVVANVKDCFNLLFFLNNFQILISFLQVCLIHTLTMTIFRVVPFQRAMELSSLFVYSLAKCVRYCYFVKISIEDLHPLVYHYGWWWRVGATDRILLFTAIARIVNFNQLWIVSVCFLHYFAFYMRPVSLNFE